MINNESANQSLAEACVILGLAPPFTADKAKSRYREMAKLYHPDVGLIKDSSRFAEISRAYDLVDANIQRLATFKLTASTQGDANRSKLQDLLQELHTARTETVTAEAHARQMADEAEAMRRYYSAMRTGSRKGLILAILAAAATACLGVLAGLVWSHQSPIMTLKPGTKFSDIPLITSNTITMAPLEGAATNVFVQIEPIGEGLVSLDFNNADGKVVNESGTASLQTTPTATLTRLPQIRYTVLIPTPIPTPPPNPASTPPPAVATQIQAHHQSAPAQSAALNEKPSIDTGTTTP